MGDKETNVEQSCASQCSTVRSRWNYNIRNVLPLAKVSAYKKNNPPTHSCCLKTLQLLANAEKVGAVECWVAQIAPIKEYILGIDVLAG